MISKNTPCISHSSSSVSRKHTRPVSCEIPGSHRKISKMSGGIHVWGEVCLSRRKHKRKEINKNMERAPACAVCMCHFIYLLTFSLVLVPAAFVCTAQQQVGDIWLACLSGKESYFHVSGWVRDDCRQSSDAELAAARQVCKTGDVQNSGQKMKNVFPFFLLHSKKYHVLMCGWCWWIAHHTRPPDCQRLFQTLVIFNRMRLKN